MSVPLIEGTSGTAGSGSSSSEQTFSRSSERSDSARDIVTLHVGDGDGVTISQNDLELLILLVQTALLFGWFYSEVIGS